MKLQNFESVSSNFSSKLIRGAFGVLPNVADVWFHCKCVMDSQIEWFYCCICLRVTKTSSMDGTISFIKNGHGQRNM